jgi:septal ring factor EnvC (AmiA/AmiB activator)
MGRIIKISLILVLSLFIVIGPYSCKSSAGDTVTREQYDALQAQLDAAEAKIAELQAAATVPPTTVPDTQSLRDEIASLDAEIAALGDNITDLDNRNAVLTQEKASLEARYEDLNAEYDQLQATLYALNNPPPITEENVEAEIMRLLNEARVNAGINEFNTGDILYKQAKKNSQHMAESGKEETVSTTFFQEVFWAAGYDSVATIARGALLIWQLNPYRFEHNILFDYNRYGAVGAVISGDIIYITLLASPYP